MNTNISKYDEEVLLNEGEKKDCCDCGGQLTMIFSTSRKNLKIIRYHCELCTQDYLSIENIK